MANNNFLVPVKTYNESNLALLLNSFCFLSTANKKFQRFNDDVPKNLGDTVSFDLPPRFTTKNSLVVSFQPAVQRVQNLTVDQQVSTAYEFTAQQFIFNAREYMDKFGRSVVAEIGTKIEAHTAKLAETNTYRFFGDGVNAISSYGQLAQALAIFRNYGSAKDNTRGYLSDLTVPAIVNSGLNQFTLEKNKEEMMSWQVGSFSNCDWYQSNLLTTHTAGTVGNAAATLTVVSTQVNSSGAVVAITFSGAPSPNDPNAIKQYDKMEFNDGVGSLPNIRYLTFIGHQPSQATVQVRAEADAGSSAGPNQTVTVSIYPPLQATQGQDQNITTQIVPGMQVSVLPNHRCGLITAGNPLYLAAPRLPDEVPFPTSVVTDPDSGMSLRQYYGSLFGQNQRGMVHDQIWGNTLVDEYSMMIALPA